MNTPLPGNGVPGVSDLDNYRRKQRNRNTLLSLANMRMMPRPISLIKGVLYSDMEHTLFGPQGVSKTFLVIDFALHMAFARPWMGHPVEHGRTLIVCGEGGGRVMADRMEAWLTHHEIADDSAADDLIRITEYPVPMLEQDQVDELLELIRCERESGGFDFIVIDTLAANFGGGDENTQADMSKFCDAMRRVRLETGAGVMVVHHTGHADRTRPQGANNLRRNVDIELRVDRDADDMMLFGIMGGGELKCRHGAGVGLIPFELKVVETGQFDDTDEPVTSCVIVPTQDVPKFDRQSAKTAKIGNNQRKVLKIFQKIAKVTEQDVRNPEGVYIASDNFSKEYKKEKLTKQQVYSVKKSFKKNNWIMECVGGLKWFPLLD